MAEGMSLDFDKIMQELGDSGDSFPLEKIRGLTSLMGKYKEKMNNIPFSSIEERRESESRASFFNRSFEEKLEEKGLKNMQRMLPYLDLKYQRGFLVYTKLLEVQILQDMFAESREFQGNSRNKHKDILGIFFDSIPYEKRKKMDGMFQMMGLLEVFKDSEFGSFGGFGMDKSYGDYSSSFNEQKEESSNVDVKDDYNTNYSIYEGGFFDEKFRL